MGVLYSYCMDLADFLHARFDEEAEWARADQRGYRTGMDEDRRLADALAKKRIVDEHAGVQVYGDPAGPSDHLVCGVCQEPDGSGPKDYPCPTLRLLALPYTSYSSFRDYLAEWKPAE